MRQTLIPTGGILYEPEEPGIYHSISWHHGLNGTFNTQGMGLEMANGLQVPYNVYCFQNPNQADWSKNEISDCAKYTQQKENLGIHVFGWSQGGQAVAAWLNFQRSIVTTAGFISGWTQMTNYSDFINIPIRAWHGDCDTTININRIKGFIAGVAAAGGDASLKVYPGADHNIVNQATSVTDPESTWKWLESKIKPQNPISEAIISQIWNGYQIVSVTDKGTVLKIDAN